MLASVTKLIVFKAVTLVSAIANAQVDVGFSSPPDSAFGTTGQLLWFGNTVEHRSWFPATFFFGDDSCTATAIGPRVLLTAAHCLERAKSKGEIMATCTPYPSFLKSISPKELAATDLALCYTQERLKLPWFETLSANLPSSHRNKDAIMVGLDSYVGGGPKKLAFAKRIVGSVQKSADASIINVGGNSTKGRCQTEQNDWSHTSPGDSGGALFAQTQELSDRRMAFRLVIGVSSRAVARCKISRYAAVANENFLEWAREWSRKNNNAQVCGITNEIDTKNCRK